MRRFLLPGFLGTFFAVLAAATPVHAADPWCLISNIPCNENLFQVVKEKFIDNFLRFGIVAIVFGMFAYYAIALLFSGEDENAATQMKTAFGHAIAGCAVVGVAILISENIGSVTTPTNPLTGATGTQIRTGLEKTTEYFKLLVGALVSLHVTYQGIRLIALQGKEEEVSKQKAKFFHGLIGVAVVLLANAIVSAVQPGNNANILSNEIRGIANFLITLFGLLAVVAFMASAAMLMLSVDESWKEKGKKGMFGSVVVLIVVFSSWAIVRYVLGFA